MPEAVQNWSFTVEGMSCSGCMRKIRSAVDKNFNVENLKFDLSRHQVTVAADQRFDREEFIKQVSALGFSVRPFVGTPAKTSHRRHLAQLGVAGACAGNIMLISVALYSGAEATALSSVLNGFIFLLFMPVLFFSALPFYKNCLLALKSGKASVDIPIVLALWAGTLLGAYNLFTGSRNFYFDSLASLVFLILASRYFVLRIQEAYLSPVSISDILGRSRVFVVREGKKQLVDREDVQRGDKILLQAGDYLPADAKLESDSAEWDCAFLSGESRPVLTHRYETIEAGSRLISGEAEVVATASSEGSRIQRLLERLNHSLQSKTDLTSMTDKAAQYFTYLVVGVSALFLLFTLGNPEIDSLGRVLALLVISCPCVLAIATPLAISLSVKKSMKRGLLVKRPDVFERMCSVENFVFDKTGTLTSGDFSAVGFHPEFPTLQDQSVCKALEKDSPHPYALALLRVFSEAPIVRVDEITEVPGKGVSGVFEDRFYELKKPNNSDSVGFFVDGELVWSVQFKSQHRSMASEIVQQIRSCFQSISLLTGDNKEAALASARALGFPEESVLADVQPEEKAAFVEQLGKTAYLGDGINDCLAMSRADVAISMSGGSEATFRSSDVHMVTSNLGSVLDLIKISQDTLRTIKSNLVLSFFYNSAFGVVALAGWINPLAAAVLMPVSTITVVLHALYRLGGDKT